MKQTFRMPRRLGAALLLALLLAAFAAADVVEQVDGRRIEGTVAGFDAAGALQMNAGGRSVSIPRDAILSIQFRPSRPASHAGQAVLLLRNGDVIVGSVAGGTTSSLTVQSLPLGAVEIPFDAVRAIEFEQTDGPGAESDMENR